MNLVHFMNLVHSYILSKHVSRKKINKMKFLLIAICQSLLMVNGEQEISNIDHWIVLYFTIYINGQFLNLVY
jgi:hypothetical protein